MKRTILLGAMTVAALAGSVLPVSAATHPNNHGKTVSTAAHNCKHGTAANRDAHGDCVSAVAKKHHK